MSATRQEKSTLSATADTDLSLQEYLRRRAAACRDGSAGPPTEELEAMILHSEYPCLGARSVIRRVNATWVLLRAMDDEDDLQQLHQALTTFGQETEGSEEFVSCIAVFADPVDGGEAGFERSLWSVLQHLHDQDTQDWSDEVAADPSDPHFAFSVSGTAFFVVGLHPEASRVARRAPIPTLVFNRHDQFERLREQGAFDRMRETIRARDVRVQGDVNPMVEDHGSGSEARQYSGRAVSDDWEPPFTQRQTDETGRV